MVAGEITVILLKEEISSQSDVVGANSRQLAKPSVGRSGGRRQRLSHRSSGSGGFVEAPGAGAYDKE